MTIMESSRMKGDGTEHTALKLAGEGEIYGAGMFEALADKYPELADKATATATMEWLNVHLCEELGHARGMSLSQTEKASAATRSPWCSKDSTRTSDR